MKTRDQIISEILDKLPPDHRRNAKIAIGTVTHPECPMQVKDEFSHFSYYIEWIKEDNGHESLKLTITVGLPYLVSYREYEPVGDGNSRWVERVFPGKDWRSVSGDIQVLEGGERLILGEHAIAALCSP